MKLKTNNKSKAAAAGSSAGLKTWLNEEKKIQFRERGIYSTYLKFTHSELTYRLHPLEFLVLDRETREKVNNVNHLKYLRQLKKLRSLISLKQRKLIDQQSSFSDHKFFDRFVNLTSVTFTPQENQLIEKGFKFNIQDKNSVRTLETLGVDTKISPVMFRLI